MDSARVRRAATRPAAQLAGLIVTWAALVWGVAAEHAAILGVIYLVTGWSTAAWVGVWAYRRGRAARLACRWGPLDPRPGPLASAIERALLAPNEGVLTISYGRDRVQLTIETPGHPRGDAGFTPDQARIMAQNLMEAAARATAPAQVH